MASVTFSPGSYQLDTANYLSWDNRDPPVGLANTSALSSTSGVRYTLRIRLWRDGRDNWAYVGNVAHVPDSGSPFDVGQDFNTDWETAAQAVKFTAAHGSLTLRGPDHPDTIATDTLEPYSWAPEAYDLNAEAWVDGFLALTDTEQAAVTITLDDGEGGAPTPEALAMEATAGDPTAAFNLRAVQTEALAMTARAGDPTAAFNARAVVVQALSMTARAGDPTATFNAQAVAEVVAPAADSAIKRWLVALLLPWDLLGGRWATALAVAEIHQGLVDAGYEAASEWSPATCRDATLPEWARILTVPRRSGETTPAWRRRIVHWRDEPVGESGWVADEVQHVTADDPPKVLEFPRDSGRWGYGMWGTGRWGVGPVLVVGVDPSMRADVEAVLERGVPPHVGISYLAPDVFAAVLAGPVTP